MISATGLVLMMTIPGLALFYCGMVRKKNVLATMAQSFACTVLCSLLWFFVGYSLTFIGDGSWLGTFERVFCAASAWRRPAVCAKTIPELLFMFYQMTFAIITVALVAGSVADRMRFSAFLWFAVGWLIFVYVPIAHWVWGGGFLARAGVLDFAGGTVVHLNAGVAGLVAAYVVGKRYGYGTDNFSPHDLSLAVIGTGLLWVGWFGFNGGSALGANSRAVFAIMATHLARLERRVDLDGAGMVDARQTVGARHDLGRGRRSRHHHAGIRVSCCRGTGVMIGLHRRRDLLLGLHQAEADARLRQFARRLRRSRHRRCCRHTADRRIRSRRCPRAPTPPGVVGPARRQCAPIADPALRRGCCPGLVGALTYILL